MSDWHALTPDRHGQWTLRPEADLRIAAESMVVPLAVAELRRAVSQFPLAFMPTASGHYDVFALLSLRRGTCPMVGHDGRWQEGYIPAALRAHPFALLPRDDDDRMTLSVDEDSPRLDPLGERGAPLFTGGEPSDTTERLLHFLTETHRSRQRTRTMTAALAAQGLIQPWSLSVTLMDKPQRLEGLYAIDGPCLEALGDDAFLGLRAAGALMLAHAQLLAQGNIAALERLHRLAEPGRLGPEAAAPDGYQIESHEDALLVF